MLVAFSVGNFRSYRDVQTISLLAVSGKELRGNTFVPKGVAGLRGQRLLKSVAIYGANASGKSNFVRAFSFFFRFICRSATDRVAGSPIPVTPFMLGRENQTKPTSFKATFVVNEVLHEYSFCVSHRRVESEELIAYPKKLGRRLFKRWVDDNGETHWQFSRIHFHRDKELEARTRQDALYLSVGAQWNHPQLTPIFQWARRQYSVVLEGDFRDRMRWATTQKCIENERFCAWAADVLRSAGTGILDLQARMIDASDRYPAEVLKNIPEEHRKQFTHRPQAEVVHQLNGSRETISWGLEEESDGTQQLFALLNPWHGMLHRGSTAVVDELDSSLHPRLSRQLIEMVHSDKTNPHGGQLLFTTHDTSIMDPTLMRRDQVYLTSKDESGASQLYPLLAFKPRKGEALQKGYLSGRYGGVPLFGRFDIGTPPAAEESE